MTRYAGVGSRNITDEEWSRITKLSLYLGLQGHVLNSGHADGSDLAFETGSHEAVVKQGDLYNDHIFLPYSGFNRKRDLVDYLSEGCYVVPEMNEEAEQIVTAVVPYLERLKYDKKTGQLSFTWKAFLRNAYQVLGMDLHTHVDYLLCCSDWSKNGSVEGGTRVAYDLGVLHKIPCFNIRYPDEYSKFKLWFTENFK